MAKKNKAIYDPGELDRVRGKLGSLDREEAKRMMEVLGGEIGYERSEAKETPRPRASRLRHETVDVMVGRNGRPSSGQPKRRVELAPDAAEETGRRRRVKAGDPSDDPSLTIKTSYRERVKMDKFAAQPEFEIKTSAQVFYSMISLFGEIPDYVNSDFVTRRMNDYYKNIEFLVASTRSMFPRNNLQRNERLKKASPFAFLVLDTIRYWNLEKITSELARIQSHPRNVKVADFSDILRAVYKPLFILELLDPDTHIRESYKLLYKVLYLENPGEAKKKHQDLIRHAYNAYLLIRKDVHYMLYPLLLKLLSDRWISYEKFFVLRKNRYMHFLNVTEGDHIFPAPVVVPVDEGENVEQGDAKNGGISSAKTEGGEASAAEEAEKKSKIDSENRILSKSLQAMEVLFPKAGWDRLSTYPDLYPYFSSIIDLKKGYVLVSPTDPMQQIAILMHILEELFFGLRYVAFGTVQGADGNPERIDDYLNYLISNWRGFIENSFEKEYLPRLEEYCRILDSSVESRTSNYAKRLFNELNWIKRLYFLPYYRFENLFPPPFQKKEIKSIYPEIRKLRRYLTAVAAGIEQGNKLGGSEKAAPCDGIDNPWEPYVFQISNPVSKRLDALYGAKAGSRKNNNAVLVYFTLSVAVILDHLVNYEKGWAYGENTGPIFRSVNGEGAMPLFGVDTEIDANLLFKQALKQRERKEASALQEQQDQELN